MICSFFGHKDAPASLYPEIKAQITHLILHRQADSFMVGNQGNFDSMVLRALRELKKAHPHICYNVVLAYMPQQKQEYILYTPEETFLPEGLETVPKRFAISFRNKWMVRQSDAIVCYIRHAWGGAAQFVTLAKKQNKEIINLFE